MIKEELVGIVAVCAFLAVSCDNKSEETVWGNDVIEIQTTIGSIPRSPSLDDSGKGNFVSGDVFSVFTAGEGFEPVSANYEVGKTELTWSGMDLPSNVRSVNISACYPQQAINVGGTFVFDLNTAGEKDLLLAKSQAIEVRTENPVRLSFTHALHQLQIHLTATGEYTEEELASLQVSCQARSACVIDALAGNIEEVKDKVATFSANGKQVSFILVPQRTDMVTLTFSINDKSCSYQLNNLLAQLENPQDELKGGCRLILNLNLVKEGTDLIIVEDATIGAWEEQGSIDGEITLE